MSSVCMNPPTMDDTDTERIHFMTPLLTPHLSESSTSDYHDLESSFSQIELQQQLSNLTRNLQEISDLRCPSDEHESESDIQDQQPTEATDDSNDPSQLRIVTVDIINDSLHSLPSEEHDDDSLSAVQETELVEDSFSTVTSDIETIPNEERAQRPVLNYSLSLCVPYTDEEIEEDEISIIKEKLTETTTMISEFAGIKKKHKNDLGHIMMSYNNSTRVLCSKIAKYLKNRGYSVWIDQDNISGDVFTSMASAVENSFVVLMAVNEKYYKSRYCRLEAEYSVEQNKASIPMLMQAGYKSSGWLGIINGSKLYIDFSQLLFDEAFTLLVREIEAVRMSLGADENDRTFSIPVNNQITTTINNSWFHSRNVHQWTIDDVIEWLNQKKLEMFENGLTRFTGATLWQLYKIKFDSASDYFRMVDSLLPPTIPLRLLHTLTFNEALESLFSTSSQAMHR